MSVVGHLRADQWADSLGLRKDVENLTSKNPNLQAKLRHPGRPFDRLYPSNSIHVGQDGSPRGKCSKKCGQPRPRKRRADDVHIHCGLVGSTNRVIKNAMKRDSLSREHGIICVETEAAGLMDNFPCLIIRGICDYADSHKNDDWQGFAAAVAAVTAVRILSLVSNEHITSAMHILDEKDMKFILDSVKTQVVKSTNALDQRIEVAEKALEGVKDTMELLQSISSENQKAIDELRSAHGDHEAKLNQAVRHSQEKLLGQVDDMSIYLQQRHDTAAPEEREKWAELKQDSDSYKTTLDGFLNVSITLADTAHNVLKGASVVSDNPGLNKGRQIVELTGVTIRDNFKPLAKLLPGRPAIMKTQTDPSMAERRPSRSIIDSRENLSTARPALVAPASVRSQDLQGSLISQTSDSAGEGSSTFDERLNNSFNIRETWQKAATRANDTVTQILGSNRKAPLFKQMKTSPAKIPSNRGTSIAGEGAISFEERQREQETADLIDLNDYPTMSFSQNIPSNFPTVAARSSTQAGLFKKSERQTTL
jgi:hypothetical protein